MSQDLLVRLPCDFSGNGLQNQRMLTLDHLVEWLPTSGQVGFLSSRTFYLDEIVHAQSLSHVRLFVTQWIAAHQAPLSMEFSRQEYWSRVPFPSPGDLPDLGIKPRSPTLQADSLASEPPGITLLDNDKFSVMYLCSS